MVQLSMPAGNAGVAVTPQRPVGPPPKFSSEVGTNGVPRAPRRNGKVVSYTAGLLEVGRGLLGRSVQGWRVGRGWLRPP